MVENGKEKYAEFCQGQPGIPIFSRPWWLDAVAGERSWDVAIVEAGGRVVASMPYYRRVSKGLKQITMPPLTQTLGPYITPSNGKYAKQLAREKDLMLELIAQLPAVDKFSQKFHYSITNWLPFFWKGFSQTTYYTYLIEDLSSLENVWSEIKSNIKTDIRKAEKRVEVRCDLEPARFYRINEMTFQRQGKRIPYSFDFFIHLDHACAMKGCRRIFFAIDNQGRIHAAVYIIWDENSAYYLMGGADPGLRNSGATSLLMWEAIRFASTVTGRFDFEGSMIEPVERFFRAFGAKQIPYFHISKVGRRMKILTAAKEMANAVQGLLK